MNTIPFKNRVSGAFLGAIIGDALGLPYEFASAASIAEVNPITFDPPPDFGRYHGPLEAGTYSDDSAQILALADSLLDRSRYDSEDFTQRLLRWVSAGDYAIDNKPFGVGQQTVNALRQIADGTDIRLAARYDENANGNGSLMRVIALALWHQGSDAELVRDAHLQSQCTHPHPRTLVACATYCLWVRQLLRGVTEIDWKSSYYHLIDIYVTEKAHLWGDMPKDRRGNLTHLLQEVDHVFHPHSRSTPQGTGYVVDTLWSAYAALQEATFEDCILKAIRYGYDTDTTACVTGGLAGIKFGVGAIPADWVKTLRGSEVIQPILGRLLDHTSSFDVTTTAPWVRDFLPITAMGDGFFSSFVKPDKRTAIIWIGDLSESKQKRLETEFAEVSAYYFEDITPFDLDPKIRLKYKLNRLLKRDLFSIDTKLITDIHVTAIAQNLEAYKLMHARKELDAVLVITETGRGTAVAIARYASLKNIMRFDDFYEREPNLFVMAKMLEANKQ